MTVAKASIVLLIACMVPTPPSGSKAWRRLRTPEDILLGAATEPGRHGCTAATRAGTMPRAGELAERSNAAVLKTVDPQGSGGSNPSLSASLPFVSRAEKAGIPALTIHCFGMTLPDILKAQAADTIGVNWTEATTVTLDDIYGSDQDRFPLEQEAKVWDAEDLGLVW